MKHNTQNKIIIFVIFFFAACALGSALCTSAFAQALEKLTKLMPSGTELLSRNEGKSQPFLTISEYKYGSIGTSESIVQFYRHLFKNEGFTEFQGYSPQGKPLPRSQTAYFFSKPDTLVILNILTHPENNLTVYYIAVHITDTKAIKNFNAQEE